jgi:hypothetical protein
MKRGFLDLLDPSNDPEFFWQVISGPPCILKVCLNSKFPPTLHSTLDIQPTTLFGEKCVRLYLLGYHQCQCQFPFLQLKILE